MTTREGIAARQNINDRPSAEFAFDEAAIEQAIREARKLRAEEMRRIAIWLSTRPGAIGAWLRGAKPRSADAGAELQTTPGERIRNALAALRSSAELLRDHPEIDPAQRRRHLDIVLAEEARLESLVVERGDRRSAVAA